MSVSSARQSRKSPAAIKTKFLSESRSNINKIFCFYEGEDRKYYNDRIKNTLRINLSDLQTYDCDGKKGVLETYRLVAPISKSRGIKTLFFIDKDYISQRSKKKNVFETNTYSIENYYANIDCFKNVLTTICGVNSSEPDYTKAVNDFNKALNDFNSSVLELNSWLYCQKKNNSNANVPFHDLDIMKWFNASSIHSISAKEPINQAFIENQRRFRDSPLVSNSDFESAKKHFQEHSNPTESFMGKFQIAFFTKYLYLLQNEIINDYFIGRSKLNLVTSLGDILTNLSSLASTPGSLIDFILSNAS